MIGTVVIKQRAKLVRLITYFFSVLFIQSISASDYVGSTACKNCHNNTYNAWQGSHHQLAMQHASEETVLANFDNISFNFRGKTNRLFRKDDQFWVNIEGADGEFHDYQVRYTFGFKPLQQYMVEFEDGRIQLIPFSWDSRPENQGGQRWYHLYPKIKQTDEFYWTNTGQNWNFMCADCHSTNVQKNYDPKQNTYQTTWSEISVGCEACHGPGSEHLKWASTNKTTPASPPSLYGFKYNLSKAVNEWVYKDGLTTLSPKSINPTNQLQVCAQCHSRRVQLTEKNSHINRSFLDRYRLSLITPELYHLDGQIYDENYVYGSFLQSKMAEKGVTCTNCHDPHSAKLNITSEDVCAQCHIKSEYSAEKHTFHKAGTNASLCTSCHMPETTYMQVDPRRDHSWQIPRPDLSKYTGTPNACINCHGDKSNEWAEEKLSKWFPNSDFRDQKHFSVAFYAAEISHQSAADALSYVAQNHTESDIIRASALQRLDNYPNPTTLVTLSRAVKSNNEILRYGAIQGSMGFPQTERWKLLEPLLNDSVLTIRSEAAGVLVQHWMQMSVEQQQALSSSLEDYIEIQQYNSDRGFAHTNLGNIYRAKNESDKAIKAYRQAILVEPYYANSYINLADLYRSLGNEKLAFSTLKKGLKAQPKSASLSFSSGLSLLRQGNRLQAIEHFKNATDIDTNNAQYWFVYGLSLEVLDISKADTALSHAFKLSNNPEHLYARCDMLIKHQAPDANACITMLKPHAPPNIIKQLQLRLKP